MISPGTSLVLVTNDGEGFAPIPNGSLEFVKASVVKQRAYIKRIWEAEMEVQPKNAGIADFLPEKDISQETIATLNIGENT
jgi:hypothetical protein